MYIYIYIHVVMYKYWYMWYDTYSSLFRYIAMQSAVDPEYLQMQAPSEPTYISPADPPTCKSWALNRYTLGFK